MIELKNEYLHIGILPELGAGLVFMKATSQIGQVDLMRESPRDITHPSELACFISMPWSNQISAGGITLEGTFYPIIPNAGDIMPLHGDSWLLEWEMTECSLTHASFVLDAAALVPFDYSATVDYRLNEKQLEIRVALTHMGDQAVPYGMGIHSNFIRTPHATLETSALEIYLDTVDSLPTHYESVEKHSSYDFRKAKVLPNKLIKHQYQKFEGHAEIKWPELLCGLQIINHSKWPYMVLEADSLKATSFNLGIMSHLANAHHHQSPKDEGLVWLKNGQTLATKHTLKLFEV